MSGYWPPSAVGVDPSDYSDGQAPVKDDATGLFVPGSAGSGGSSSVRGTATIGEAETSVDVPHGLEAAPERGEIQVSPANDMGAASKWWLSGFGPVSFTVNVDVAPGTGESADFDWLWTPATESEGVATQPGISVLGTIESQASYGGVMGWEFTVGGSDLSAVGLRVYMPSAQVRTLALWRVSDEALLESVSVTTVADGWASAAIPATVLSASTNYIVSVQIDGASYYRSGSPPSGFTFASGLSFVQGRFDTTPTDFPGSDAGRVYGVVDVVLAV